MRFFFIALETFLMSVLPPCPSHALWITRKPQVHEKAHIKNFNNARYLFIKDLNTKMMTVDIFLKIPNLSDKLSVARGEETDKEPLLENTIAR